MVNKQLSETVKLLSVVFLMETEISGSIWKYFKISGRYLEILGNTWKYLEIFENGQAKVFHCDQKLPWELINYFVFGQPPSKFVSS